MTMEPYTVARDQSL
uniref:Uncharacterized protein n=1 Tax=Rhizophora mucronata TaxID=61149 RepID=A0A2P2NIG3_RHIMU